MAPTASRMEIESGLYAALAESRSSTPAAVRAAVGAGGQVDSLEGIELVVAAEAQFGVTIPDEELSSGVCSSIPRLVDLVISKIGAASVEGE